MSDPEEGGSTRLVSSRDLTKKQAVAKKMLPEDRIAGPEDSSTIQTSEKQPTARIEKGPQSAPRTGPRRIDTPYARPVPAKAVARSPSAASEQLSDASGSNSHSDGIVGRAVEAGLQLTPKLAQKGQQRVLTPKRPSPLPAKRKRVIDRFYGVEPEKVNKAVKRGESTSSLSDEDDAAEDEEVQSIRTHIKRPLVGRSINQFKQGPEPFEDDDEEKAIASPPRTKKRPLSRVFPEKPSKRSKTLAQTKRDLKMGDAPAQEVEIMQVGFPHLISYSYY